MMFEIKGKCRECGKPIDIAPPFKQCEEYIGSYPHNENEHPVICYDCFRENDVVKTVYQATDRVKNPQSYRFVEEKPKKNKFLEKYLGNRRKDEFDD